MKEIQAVIWVSCCVISNESLHHPENEVTGIERFLDALGSEHRELGRG